MARVLLDANILIYLANPDSALHQVCEATVEDLIRQGEWPVVCTQVLFEFRVGATRPTSSNGLGWPAGAARLAIDEFRRDFDLVHARHAHRCNHAGQRGGKAPDIQRR